MKKALFTVFFLSTLSGCAHEEFPLVPEPESIEKVDGIKISYILPPSVDDKVGFYGVEFKGYDAGRDSKVTRLHFYRKNDNLEVEKRVDNTVAGSGVIYQVDVSRATKGNNRIVTFIPKMRRKYQQGLVLPFPVPELDLQYVLSSGISSYQLELTADYPPDSVKANFERIWGKNYRNYYVLKNSEEAIEVHIKIYPYKNNKSKILFNIMIENKKAHNGVINIAEKINKLNKQIQDIIDS